MVHHVDKVLVSGALATPPARSVGVWAGAVVAADAAHVLHLAKRVQFECRSEGWPWSCLVSTYFDARRGFERAAKLAGTVSRAVGIIREGTPRDVRQAAQLKPERVLR